MGIDPNIRGAACAGADGIVVRIVLHAFANVVSLNRIAGGSGFSANTVATASPNVIRLDSV